ncbi:MAG: hypothetical protein HC822_09535 [Oscillochloris sp.]|nr:hypothetical protein [Oscillochloris sp.]
MQVSEIVKDAPIEREDVSRWVVFSGFWGSIFYLLSCVSEVAAARRRPVRLDTQTLGMGYGMHVATFVIGGSILNAGQSLVVGKSSTEQAQESIGGGQLQRTWPLQALGGAAGSVVPLAMAVASQKVAENITGRPAIDNDINWPVAAGTMVVITGLTALAVSRITSWVARDAKRGSGRR